MDDQRRLAKMLGEGLLEVRALCHNSALAVGDFGGVSSILLKVDRDLEVLRKLPQGSDEHKHLHK